MSIISKYGVDYDKLGHTLVAAGALTLFSAMAVKFYSQNELNQIESRSSNYATLDNQLLDKEKNKFELYAKRSDFFLFPGSTLLFLAGMGAHEYNRKQWEKLGKTLDELNKLDEKKQ